MNFNQRHSSNRWIRENGCAFVSSLYLIYRMLDLEKKLNISVDEWYEIAKWKKLFTADGYVIWNRLTWIFPSIEIEHHLWNGKHRNDNITKNSIISVDYTRDPKYTHSHFVAVEDFTLDDLIIYNSYFGTIELLSMRYLINNSVKDSIFSIINFSKG